jgi:hypothetical protein
MLEGANESTRWLASECSIEIFARASNASVASAIFSELTPAVYPELGPSYQDASLSARGGITPPWLSQYGRDSKASFSILFEALNGLKIFLTGIVGYIQAASDHLGFWGNADVMQALLVQNFTMCQKPEDKLTCAATNMAKALTKTFRDASYIAAQQSNPDASLADNMVAGQAFRFGKLCAYPLVLDFFARVGLGFEREHLDYTCCCDARDRDSPLEE